MSSLASSCVFVRYECFLGYYDGLQVFDLSIDGKILILLLGVPEFVFIIYAVSHAHSVGRLLRDVFSLKFPDRIY